MILLDIYIFLKNIYLKKIFVPFIYLFCFDFRNVSSAGDYGRKKLRECEGLVDALIYLVRNAIERANIDNKSVENAVCVLRNLSFRAQEIEDPNYDKRQLPVGETRAAAKPNSENLGCFGASKNKGKPGTQGNSTVSSQGIYYNNGGLI